MSISISAFFLAIGLFLNLGQADAQLDETAKKLESAIQKQAPDLLKFRKQKTQVRWLLHTETPAVTAESKSADAAATPMTKALAPEELKAPFQAIFAEAKKPKWILEIDVIELNTPNKDNVNVLQISVIEAKSKNKKYEFGLTINASDIK